MAILIPVNHFDSASIALTSTTGVSVSSMPVTNLQNTIRGDMWRSGDLSIQRIFGNWGGNGRTISAIQLWPNAAMQSVMIGSKVRFRGYSDVGGVSSVKDTGELDFFTYTGLPYGTFLWGDHPWGVEKGDLLARRAL